MKTAGALRKQLLLKLEFKTRDNDKNDDKNDTNNT